MSDLESYLPELAKIELSQIAGMAETEAECKELAASVQQKYRQKLAEIPARLQEERQAALDRARSRAERMAEDIRSRTRKDSERLARTLEKFTNDIVDKLFRAMISECDTTQRKGEPSE